MMVFKTVLLGAILVTTQTAFCQRIDSIYAADLVAATRAAKGIQVVNFWSTLCGPCLQEIPYYLTVVDSFKRLGYPVQLTLVSLDFGSYYRTGRVHRFVQQRGWWAAKQLWLNEQYPDEYVPKIDSTWFGALPATQVLNNGSGYGRFYDGSMSHQGLIAALQAAISQPRR
jgi:thiol-disulfide isomerase/thioredoxin